jgi:hypothetical protein
MAMTSRISRRHLAVALLGSFLAALAGNRAHAQSDIPLKPAGAHDFSGLKVNRLKAESTANTAVEKVKPEESWDVRGLTVSLNADSGLCGTETIEAILSKPDAAAPSVQGSDCLFAVLIAVDTASRPFEAGGECGEWIANTARCSGFGETGEFRIVRDKPSGPSRFDLVFPSAADAAKTTPVAGGDQSGQRFGMFLDSVLDPKTGSHKGDVWMVWGGTTVKLGFTR